MPAVDWLGDPRTSIPATLIFVVWKIFGYNLLVVVAALATVPQDPYCCKGPSIQPDGAASSQAHVWRHYVPTETASTACAGARVDSIEHNAASS